MNPLNYTSLEASKRLVDAGIVLETEAVWRKKRDKTGYYLSRKALYHRTSDIPAPSMAEVWRELPEASAYLHTNKETEVWLEDEEDIIPKSNSFANTNPTDSLIYLLIWVRKEASHGGHQQEAVRAAGL